MSLWKDLPHRRRFPSTSKVALELHQDSGTGPEKLLSDKTAPARLVRLLRLLGRLPVSILLSACNHFSCCSFTNVSGRDPLQHEEAGCPEYRCDGSFCKAGECTPLQEICRFRPDSPQLVLGEVQVYQLIQVTNVRADRSHQRFL